MLVWITGCFKTTTGSSQTIASTPPIIPTAPVFSDVSASYWGYNAISSLSSKDIVSGYPDVTFKTDASITRAEFDTILVKALGLKTSGTSVKFTDVTSDAWYWKNYIVWQDNRNDRGYIS